MNETDQRLLDDYTRVKELCKANPGLIKIIRAAPPVLPTEYEIEFYCTGIYLNYGAVTECHQHGVRITLGPNYPTEPPTLFWVTPIYHPNGLIGHACQISGDKWSPSIKLDTVCIWLWDTARYRRYNVNDPLDKTFNHQLAPLVQQWLSQSGRTLPLDERTLNYPGAMSAKSVRGLRTSTGESRELTIQEIKALIKVEGDVP